jgi:hypothetical protein
MTAASLQDENQISRSINDLLAMGLTARSRTRALQERLSDALSDSSFVADSMARDDGSPVDYHSKVILDAIGSHNTNPASFAWDSVTRCYFPIYDEVHRSDPNAFRPSNRFYRGSPVANTDPLPFEPQPLPRSSFIDDEALEVSDRELAREEFQADFLNEEEEMLVQRDSVTLPATTSVVIPPPSPGHSRSRSVVSSVVEVRAGTPIRRKKVAKSKTERLRAQLAHKAHKTQRTQPRLASFFSPFLAFLTSSTLL